MRKEDEKRRENSIPRIPPNKKTSKVSPSSGLNSV
jgi:hypothetical protein